MCNNYFAKMFLKDYINMCFFPIIDALGSHNSPVRYHQFRVALNAGTLFSRQNAPKFGKRIGTRRYLPVLRHSSILLPGGVTKKTREGGKRKSEIAREQLLLFDRLFKID